MANIMTTRNGMTRYRDPFHLARDLFNWDPFGDMRLSGKSAATFAPTFEVLENEDRYVLRADVPGVKEEDLEISLQDNVLTISGHRRSEEKREGETYYLFERQYGAFSRSFSLPDAADGNKVEASMQDGVLTVEIGKREETRPRKIELKK